MSETSPADILDFWREAGREKWFRGGPDFDTAIRERFEALHGEAASGVHDGWAATPEGALALVIVLDQFSRNLYRNSPKAFAADVKALGIAEMAVARGDDAKVEPEFQVFFYMPFEHSERLADQARAVALCHALHNDYLKYAILHRDVIRRFGRFPHRNGPLGRKTSPAETAFLDGGGFSAGTHPAKPEATEATDASGRDGADSS